MINISSIKQQAKKAYKFDIGRNANIEFISFITKFSVAFAIFTIYFICLAKIGSPMASPLAFICFAAIYLLYFIFLLAPMNLGRDFYFVKVANKIQPETDELFCFFRNIKVAIVPYVKFAIAVIFYTVLFAAGTICYFKLYMLFSSNYFSFLNVIVVSAIIVFYAAAIISTRIKYSFYPSIYEKYSDKDSLVILSKAFKFSKGKKFDLFLFYLSFAGWYLLGILSLGIGFIWIMPYIRIALRIYLKECID